MTAARGASLSGPLALALGSLVLLAVAPGCVREPGVSGPGDAGAFPDSRPSSGSGGGSSGSGGNGSGGSGSGGSGSGGAGSGGAPSTVPCVTAGDGPRLPQSFVGTCAGCHSAYGPSANPQVPDLFRYQGTAVAFTAEVRRGGTLMPPFSSAVISDADLQLAYDYFRAGVPAGATLCTPGGGGSSSGRTDACTDATVSFDPLFAPTAPATAQSQPQAISWLDAQGVLHTRGAGRVRGRHEMEEDFAIFHPQYFEDRSFVFTIDDTIPAGGKTVTFTYLPEASAAADPATNLRFWKVYGDGNVFHTNVGMKPADPKHWTWVASRNDRDGRAIQTGDLLEFEFGVFIDKAGLTTAETRTNYYSDTFRYRVGNGGLTAYNADPSMNDPGVNRLGPELAGYSGGATTIPFLKLHRDLSYEQMALDVQGENVRDFLQGRRLFHTDFLTGKHLESGNTLSAAELAAHTDRAGPLYNQPSCQGCHLRDGRGVAPDSGQAMRSMVIKTFGAGTDAHGAPLADVSYGRQLQDRATAGTTAEGSGIIRWTEAAGQLPDGTAYALRHPSIELTGLSAGAPARFSARLARPLIGMGLLEAIPEADLLAYADAGDCNGDGISGRPNVVWDPEDGRAHVGRLGWKAAKASVRHQVAEAALLDMGVTTRVFSAHDCGAEQSACLAEAQTASGTGAPELSDQDLERLVTYMRLLAVPARRDMERPEVQRGEIVFAQVGCASCHAPTQRTGSAHPFVELRNQLIHPYTDLLLHDLGSELADASPKDFVAEPSEWRTPPLWGIGLCDAVSVGSGDAAFPAQPPCQLLHDGRARSLLEAVLWHGGEAKAARDRAAALPAADRAALLAFLQSL